MVLKALKKEPERRYASVEQFSDDIRRHLDGLPTLAGPDTFAYRGWKFVTRHRGTVAAACAFALMLVASSVVAWALFAGAERARGLAEQRAEELLRRDYVNRIALAEHAADGNDAGRMEQLLRQCPKHLRGWEWRRLKYVCDLSRRTLVGHEEGVTAVAFSSDGGRIASASADKTLRVWDADTGAELANLTGHEDRVLDVAFHPDNKRIASAGEDHTVRIWNLDHPKVPIV